MGCSILFNLAARGMKDLVLLERDTLSCGSTGRSQAILRMHYSNEVTTRMAWESLKLFRHFDEVTGGSSGFVQTGYLLVVGPKDREGMEENVALQQTVGVNTQRISLETAQEVAPMLEVADAAGLAYEPESGYADPYAVTISFATRARELGAEVHSSSPATGIDIRGGRVRGVIAEQGRIDTPTAVIATGPWSRALFRRLGIDVPLGTVRHQVITLLRPQESIPWHPTVGDLIHNLSFRPDSTNLTMIGYGEEKVDPDTYNQGVDGEVVAEAWGRVTRRFPALAHAFPRGGWSGLFTVTPDWHPIIDRVNGIEGLYCAVGFSGHGFKLAPMVGVVMAELILEGRATTIDITPLRMSRFQEGALLRSRYSYNVLA